MAEGRELEELEKEITCIICHEHYKEPKVLPCLHYYCKQCIYSVALREGLNEPFSCPECRKTTTLPQGQADYLPSAFFINRLREKYLRLERVHRRVEAKCGACVVGGKAEAFCVQCDEFICAECVDMHRRVKKFVAHDISSLDELKEGRAKGEVTPEPCVQTCAIHQQPVNIFCFDCKTLICRDCTIKTHNSQTHNCNYEFIQVAAPEVKKKLTQQLDPMKKAKEALLHAVKEVQATKSDVQIQGKFVKDHINTSFNEMCRIMEECRQGLLAEAEQRVAVKCKRLSTQEDRLSTRHACFCSTINYTEYCMEHAADDKIMCMHSELQARIKEQIEEYRNEEETMKPVEAADIGVEVSCAQELKQLCQDKAILTSLIDPSSCAVEFDTACVELDKTSKFTVVPRVMNGGPPALNQECSVECELKSLAEASTIKCAVSRSQDNAYLCEYTPTVRGRHELTVSVNEQAVAGSPFSVHVTIHPTQLGKPVRVIPTGVLGPRDVTLSSSGEMIVAFRNSIFVYDKTGKKVRSCEASYFRITELWSVTIDRKTNGIFIVGNTSDSHKIVRLGLDLETVKEINIEGATYFPGLAVVGDELMMCNNKEGCVMVYNMELEYMRRIGSKGDGPEQLNETRGISSDERGNLYISDRGKSCILVFSNSGEFLRSFWNQLAIPFGVSVSGRYVYVCDQLNHNLVIFTTEGEYVAAIGQRGQGKGGFNYPWCVCVDQDGFVYVCDNNNCRIQIF